MTEEVAHRLRLVVEPRSFSEIVNSRSDVTFEEILTVVFQNNLLTISHKDFQANRLNGICLTAPIN